MKNHVQFVFHYRITEFMRLIVDDVDMSETSTVADVAAWMMERISDRCRSSSVRFSINGEDDDEVDNITSNFLYELLSTCGRREVERVDFEVDSEPRSVSWRSHSFTEEKVTSIDAKENQPLEGTNGELDFDDDFIDFLKKLEQRQEMIKESALSLLSSHSSVLSQKARTEKSVQTTPMALSAEVFVPELPSPDLSELHDTKLDIINVGSFVDCLFDFDQKAERSRALRRLTNSRFLPQRKLERDNKNVFKCSGKSSKKHFPLTAATPWSLRSIQQISSIADMEVSPRIEDVITLQNTAVVAHRIQKKWEQMHNEDRLSMTAALSTGIGGADESLQSVPRVEKELDKRENDEWIVGLLRMMEQKPGRSRKLLRGLVNISKEHKASKSSKSRGCDFCRRISVPRSKSFESDKIVEETIQKPSSMVPEGSQHCVDAYTYMKRKLKEHEKKKKINKECDIELEHKKLEKEKNQEDIRAYLVGRKIIERSCKTCSAQADIRDFLVGKKAKQTQKADTASSARKVSADNEQQLNVVKSKVWFSSIVILWSLEVVLAKVCPGLSPLQAVAALVDQGKPSKQRVGGKYFKLTNEPTLAVVGESSVSYIGRTSNGAAVYGKSFKVINLSRKEIQIDVVPINWPDYVHLLNPTSSTTLGPGETRNFAVTITRSSADVGSECHLLSVVHRNTPISPILSFTVDALATHYEGPLLSEIHADKAVQEVVTLRETPSHWNTVIKQEVEEISPRSAVKIDLIVGSDVPVKNLKTEQLMGSIHTAIEEDCDQCSIGEKGVVLSIDDGTPFDESSVSDFEVVDVERL
uniref:ASH domain-containing protein n=1 Tax=Angiostrongylus cantonensis TaxID=6313 RepID=A0A0K0DMU3_ANGCA